MIRFLVRTVFLGRAASLCNTFRPALPVSIHGGLESAFTPPRRCLYVKAMDAQLHSFITRDNASSIFTFYEHIEP